MAKIPQLYSNYKIEKLNELYMQESDRENLKE